MNPVQSTTVTNDQIVRTYIRDSTGVILFHVYIYHSFHLLQISLLGAIMLSWQIYGTWFRQISAPHYRKCTLFEFQSYQHFLVLVETYSFVRMSVQCKWNVYKKATSVSSVFRVHYAWKNNTDRSYYFMLSLAKMYFFSQYYDTVVNQDTTSTAIFLFITTEKNVEKGLDHHFHT